MPNLLGCKVWRQLWMNSWMVIVQSLCCLGFGQWNRACYRWNKEQDGQYREAIPADSTSRFSRIIIFQLATAATAPPTVHSIDIDFLMLQGPGLHFFLIFHHCYCQPILCVEYFSGWGNLWMHCSLGGIWSCHRTWFCCRVCILSCTQNMFLRRAATEV